MAFEFAQPGCWEVRIDSVTFGSASVWLEAGD
jgi:hypothetical protein